MQSVGYLLALRCPCECVKRQSFDRKEPLSLAAKEVNPVELVLSQACHLQGSLGTFLQGLAPLGTAPLTSGMPVGSHTKQKMLFQISAKKVNLDLSMFCKCDPGHAGASLCQISIPWHPLFSSNSKRFATVAELRTWKPFFFRSA